MQIVVPYAPGKLRPLTEAALTRAGATFVRLESEESYWRLLRDFWYVPFDLILVEHDILPWPGALDELAACPAQWCSFTYQISCGEPPRAGHGIHHAFGCTKITADLMRRTRDIWRNTKQRHWSTLDAQLCRAAMEVGETPHPHRPPVIHLKDLETVSSAGPR